MEWGQPEKATKATGTKAMGTRERGQTASSLRFSLGASSNFCYGVPHGSDRSRGRSRYTASCYPAGKRASIHFGESLAGGVRAAEAAAIRESTHSGRPPGESEFIEKIEGSTGRRLLPQRGGRPRQSPAETDQGRTGPGRELGKSRGKTADFGCAQGRRGPRL